MIWIFLTAVLLLIVYNPDFRNFMVKVGKVSLVLILLGGMVGAMIYYAEEPETQYLGTDGKYHSTIPRPDWCESPKFWDPFAGECDGLPEGSKLIEPPPPKGFEYRSPFSRSDDAEDSKGDG